MKTISVDEFRAHLDQYLAASLDDDILLTRDGKPCAMLRAVPEMSDADSDALAKSPELWQMIRERRGEQGVGWDEAKRQLDLD